MNNYAVNILDMTNPSFDAGPLNMAGLLIGPVKGGTVDTSPGKIDGMAVVLNCLDERAEAIISVLNLKTLVRAYRQGPRGGWKRLTQQEVRSL